MENFSKKCEENYERIYKYVYAMVNDTFQTEDIVQQVFLIAYEKGNTFLNHDNPTAFLYKVAKNLIYESFRRSRKNELELHEGSSITKETDVFDTLSKQRDESIDENLYLEKILANLSDDKRSLYTKYYIEQKPMQKIAMELSINEVTLRMRFVRLRREIKMLVKQLGLENL